MARFSVGGADSVSSLPTGRNIVMARFSVGGAESVSALPTGRNIVMARFSVGGAESVSSLPSGRNIVMARFSVGGAQSVSSLPAGRNIVMARFSVSGNELVSSLPSGRNMAMSRFSVGGTQFVSALPAGRNISMARFSLFRFSSVVTISPALLEDTPPSGRSAAKLTEARLALLTGQVVTLTASRERWPGLTAVEFRVQGKLLAEQTAPSFQTSFTVPFGVRDLNLEIVARDASGQGLGRVARTLAVEPSRPGFLRGRALAADGAPLANARVQVDLPGLAAEYFDSKIALTSMPDLTGRRPDRTGSVPALLYLNPEGVFGRDPFGTGLSPDYAARFTGVLEVPAAGEYRFDLAANDGAELYLDGTPVNGPVKLEAGRRALEVRQYTGVAPPRLVLSWSADGVKFQTVSPAWLFHRSGEVATDAQGDFLVEDDGLPGEIRVVTPEGEGQWVRKILQ